MWACKQILERSFKAIGCFILFILFSACTGQSAANHLSDKPDVRHPIGEVVSEMDKALMIVFQDSRNAYWFGSKEHGVYRYDGERITRFTDRDGLCDNRIRGIQEDKAGNLYFDTGKGISKFDGQQFSTLPIAENVSSDDWKLAPDDLWFEGYWGSPGPCRYDGKVLYQLQLPKHPLEEAFYAKYPNVTSYSPYEVYKIYKSRHGHIWLGTAMFGAYRFDGKSFSWISEKELIEFEDDSAPGIRSILEDKDSNFWFSANVNHKYRVEERNEGFYYQQLEGIATANVPHLNCYFMSIAEDENGAIWMATYDSGVWRYDGNKLTHYPVKIEDKYVLTFAIYKDQHGDLWLGTHNAGAWKFNGEKFEKFEPKKPKE